MNKEYLTLKWGTLKECKFTSKKAKSLFKKYMKFGSNVSAMLQKNTDEQKKIICELIDLMSGDTIYLEWDGKEVSKEKAKKYVMKYN